MADAYEDMKNDKLRELLEERDLPTSGTKDELVARLELSDAEAEGEGEGEGETPDESPDESPAETQPEEGRGTDPDAGKAATTTAVQAETPEAATPEEVVEAQERSESGKRDPETVSNAVAGDESEAEVDLRQGFQSSGQFESEEDTEPATRPRISESWEEPEPREVGRKRGPEDQFDYELLPDGRRRKLVFLPDDDEDEDESGDE